MKFRAFVFDVDGVIVDSTEECLLVTYNTILDYQNQSNFVDDIKEVPLSFQYHFRTIRNYIRSMDEYLLVLKSKCKITSQSIFQQEIDKLDFNEQKKFGELFFQQRERLKKLDYRKWLNLHVFYEGISDILKIVFSSPHSFIVTGKDRDSTLSFLELLKIPFNPDHIYAKDAAKNKYDHLLKIQKMTGVKTNEIFFIDDNITHLEKPFACGMGSYLADWGYALEEHKLKAGELKIPIISRNELKEILL